MLNSEAITVGQDAAQKFFATSVLKIPRLGATSSVATVTVENQIIRSTIRYSAVLPLNFGPIIGKDYSDISNIVTAEASLPLFLDIYIALDVSSSMGVGATQEDINVMNAAIGCAFGCHAGSDNYERAHAAGATLRIDVLRSAIAAMLKKAKGIQSSLSSSRTSSASASMLFQIVSRRCKRQQPIMPSSIKPCPASNPTGQMAAQISTLPSASNLRLCCRKAVRVGPANHARRMSSS